MSDTGGSAGLLTRLRAVVDPLDAQDAIPPGDQRRAAVLVLADPFHPGLPLLFMLRSELVSHHRGQISFPGGGAEPGDASVAMTALRECSEEMGIPPDAVELLGTLPPMVTAVSNRWLTPVVAVLRRAVEVVADPFEVAEWFRVPLTTLLTGPHRVQSVDFEGRPRQIHYYDVDGRIIWGVTGAILHDLLSRLGRTD